MAAVDVMDETFLAVPPARIADDVGGPERWARLWPDLDLEVLADRGERGVRWRVHGVWTGSMEVWLEPVGDGTVLHYFLRIDPTDPEHPIARSRGGRAGVREAARRQRGSKAVAFALKERLDGDREPGVAPVA